MKPLPMLWMVFLVLPATWGFGFDTDGRSGGTIGTGGGSGGGYRVTVISSRSGGCTGTRTTTSRLCPGVSSGGPVGVMGGGRYVSRRSYGPVGHMGTTRGNPNNRGPVGAMGSNRRPTQVVRQTPARPAKPCKPAALLQGSHVDYSRLARVQWGYSVRAMKAVLETTEEPFAVFFCPAETAKYTGGGKEAFDKYRQSFPGRPTPTTVFDERTSVEALQAAGVQKFVRVPTTTENLDLMRTYGAPANARTLVVCGFNGDPLVTLRGGNCVQSGVTGAMKDFPAQYKKWKVALQEKLDRESQTQHPRGSIEIMKWE